MSADQRVSAYYKNDVESKLFHYGAEQFSEDVLRPEVVRSLVRAQELALLCGKLVEHYKVADDVVEACISGDLSTKELLLFRTSLNATTSLA